MNKRNAVIINGLFALSLFTFPAFAGTPATPAKPGDRDDRAVPAMPGNVQAEQEVEMHRPEMDVEKPDHDAKPDLDKPDVDKPDVDKPEIEKPEINTPDHDR